MMTTIRRTLTISTAVFAVQLTACSDGPLAPDAPDAEPRFLLGGSPLAPFWLAKAPVLKATQGPAGEVTRELVVELHMDAREADALAQGKRAYQSSAGFWLNGDAIALADPRPSPITGLFDERDGNKLVVIAMPIDDATWSRIDAAATPGQMLDVVMEIDLLNFDARGGAYVVYSVEATGLVDPDGDPSR